MKYIKSHNESIKDYLKPKSEDDVKKGLEGLSPLEKLKQIERYNLKFLFTDDEYKEIIKTVSIKNPSWLFFTKKYTYDELKEILSESEINSSIQVYANGLSKMIDYPSQYDFADILLYLFKKNYLYSNIDNLGSLWFKHITRSSYSGGHININKYSKLDDVIEYIERMEKLNITNESIMDYLKPKSMIDTVGKDNWMKIGVRAYRSLKTKLLDFTDEEKQRIDDVLNVNHTKEEYCNFIIYKTLQRGNYWSLILGYDNIDRFLFRKEDGYILCIRLGEEEHHNRVNKDEELYVMSSFEGFIKFINDFNIKKQVRVTYKTNENIIQYLKPKSPEEINNKLEGLSLTNRINTIIRYKLSTEDEITKMVNSIPVSELSDILKGNGLIFKYVSKENLEKIYPVVTQIYNMVKNSPFWKIKNLRDYGASQFVNDSRLGKIVYDNYRAYFIIDIISYKKYSVKISVEESIYKGKYIRFNKGIKNENIEFDIIEDFFNVLQTNDNFPEPLRKYFTFKNTVAHSNIDKIEQWIRKRRSELDMNESIKDFLVPKSKENIEKSIENLSNPEKFEMGCKYGIVWLVDKMIDKYFKNSKSNLSSYGLELAIRNKHTDIVKLLLDKTDIGKKIDYSELSLAAAKGALDIFKLLLSETDVDPSENGNEIIEDAFFNDNHDIVKILLQDERVLRKLSPDDISKYKKESNFVTESIKDYLKPKPKEDILKDLSDLSNQEKFEQGCKHGIVWLVDEMIDKHIDEINLLNGLELAIMYSQTEVVKSLLNKTNIKRNIDYSDLSLAVAHGAQDIFKLLLSQTDFDPSQNDNELIHDAFINRCYKIVKFLLQDERVVKYLTFNDLKKYRNKVASITESIKDYLKPKPKEDILKNINKYSDEVKLNIACENNIVWLVKELLEKGVKPTNEWTHFLIPINNNYIEIVELMLTIGKIDPSVSNNQGIMMSCHNSKVDMFNLLYKYQYDDIPKFGDRLLYISLTHHALKIFKILLNDKRIKFTGDNDGVIDLVSQSISRSTKKFAELLLNDKRIIRKLKKDRVEYFKSKLESLTKVNESIKDYLKPKPKEEMLKSLEKMDAIDKFSNIFKYKLQDHYTKDQINKILEDIDLSTKIELGCEFNLVWLVKQSIEEGIDPSKLDNMLIHWAIINDSNDVIKFLLKDKRVDPSDKDNNMIVSLFYHKNYEIMELFLKDDRVRSKLDEEDLEKYENFIKKG